MGWFTPTTNILGQAEKANQEFTLQLIYPFRQWRKTKVLIPWLEVRARELRLAIYHGGVEPQLRKVVWKHILGVYPSHLNGRERMDYMRQKSAEYEALKSTWDRRYTSFLSSLLIRQIKLFCNLQLQAFLSSYTVYYKCVKFRACILIGPCKDTTSLGQTCWLKVNCPHSFT